jgi:hypothetical protein
MPVVAITADAARSDRDFGNAPPNPLALASLISEQF